MNDTRHTQRTRHIGARHYRQNLQHRAKHDLQHEADGDEVVIASAVGVQREAKVSAPLHNSNAPASMPNSGAVRKKRKGAASGGAWSYESRACIAGLLRAMPHQDFEFAVRRTFGQPDNAVEFERTVVR